MSFLFKLTIAILIVFAILFPILISSDNKLSALFWKIPKDFWVFLIIMYGAIIDWPPESPDNQYHLNK